MEKEIEKAIRETLVISNPQSIHIAVKKILLLFSVSGSLQSAEEMATIRLEKERGKNIELWIDEEQTEYWKEIYTMGVNDERSRAVNDR